MVSTRFGEPCWGLKAVYYLTIRPTPSQPQSPAIVSSHLYIVACFRAQLLKYSSVCGNLNVITLFLSYFNSSVGFLQRHQHLQSNQRFNRPRHQRATLLDCICRSWRHCCFVQQNCMVVSAAFVRLWCCRRYKWRANPSSFFKVTLIIITRREREVASNGSHSIEFFCFFPNTLHETTPHSGADD